MLSFLVIIQGILLVTVSFLVYILVFKLIIPHFFMSSYRKSNAYNVIHNGSKQSKESNNTDGRTFGIGGVKCKRDSSFKNLNSYDLMIQSRPQGSGWQ